MSAGENPNGSEADATATQSRGPAARHAAVVLGRFNFRGRGCPVSLGLALAGLGLLPAAGARSNFGEETENRLMPGAGEVIRLPTLVSSLLVAAYSHRDVCATSRSCHAQQSYFAALRLLQHLEALSAAPTCDWGFSFTRA